VLPGLLTRTGGPTTCEWGQQAGCMFWGQNLRRVTSCMCMLAAVCGLELCFSSFGSWWAATVPGLCSRVAFLHHLMSCPAVCRAVCLPWSCSDIIRQLVGRGADPTAPANNGAFPLTSAAEVGFTEVIPELAHTDRYRCGAGCVLGAEKGEGSLFLCVSCTQNAAGCTKKLCQNGC
jgi:hypothetical protein